MVEGKGQTRTQIGTRKIIIILRLGYDASN